MSDTDPIIEYPAWFVYRHDIDRLREYANKNRLGDSATAIRSLLDNVEAVEKSYDALLAVRVEAILTPQGWLLSNKVFEQVRVALEGE